MTLTARPTTYSGVKMRSRLEAAFAAWLDQERFDWSYEPCAFANARGQYLPDFLLRDVQCSWLAEPASVYVEVKPDWPENPEQLYRRMAIISDSEPEAVLVVVTKSESTSVGILEIDVSPDDVDPYPWPVVGSWVRASDGRLGIAALTGSAPWQGEYWKAF